MKDKNLIKLPKNVQHLRGKKDYKMEKKYKSRADIQNRQIISNVRWSLLSSPYRRKYSP